jgi:hypothetical protein
MNKTIEINEQIMRRAEEIIFTKDFNDELKSIKDLSMDFLTINTKLGFTFKIPKWLFTISEKQFNGCYVIPLFFGDKAYIHIE